MSNLNFKLINCEGKEVELKYVNPSDFLSQLDYSESTDIPMLDDKVVEVLYYGNQVSLKDNSINDVSDLYDFCCERE